MLREIYKQSLTISSLIFLRSVKDKWSPALQIRSILLSILVLLSSPNPDDPLNNEADNQWKTNEAQALIKTRDYTLKYAKEH